MTVAAHGGDIYQNQITYDFSVNTNPLPLPEILQKRMAEAAVHSNRYPQYDNVLLRERLAALYGFSAEEVACGNGASELFVAIVHALRPKRVGILAPSFSGYAWAAQTVGAEICSIPLREENNFAMDMAQMESLCRQLDGIGLLFLANPANPVGNKMEASLLETLLDVCEKRRITVVLDECFIAFTGTEGYVSWIRKYPHLIVVRAYTKIYAIPGIRLGYLLAQKDICEKIAHQLPEWNVSVVAQRIGMDILNDSLPGWSRRKYLKDTIELIQEEKEFLKHELTKIFGNQMTIFPSEADFLLLKTQIPLYRLLLERGILIRNCANYTGLGQDFYRIAVKGHPENVQLIEALLDIKKKGEEKRYGNIEYVLPGEIEKRSFAIIGEELKERGIVLPPEQEPVTKRVIHTSADFDYAKTMTYSPHAVQIAKELIAGGADIVTDTNMALAGINKKRLGEFGGTVHCFMADEDVAREAKARQVTRATVSMEHAANIDKPVIFAVGNAPTALISLYELMQKSDWRPAFIIGVPVGFVNVEAAKELILKTDVPHIVNRGRKGGSNVAAAIVNALLYQIRPV